MSLSTEDAELLADAHLELLAALAEGVTVLGRCDRADLIRAAHTLRVTAPAATVLPLPLHDGQEAAA